MSTGVGQKIRDIRETEGLGRQAFSDRTGINKETLIKVEQGKNDPSFSVLQKITNCYPQYTLWLMTNQVNPDAGQISPDVDQVHQDLKATGTDTE